jgi:hypothetical protein
LRLAQDLRDRGPAVPIGAFDHRGGSLIAFGVMLFVFAKFKGEETLRCGLVDVTSHGEAIET